MQRAAARRVFEVYSVNPPTEPDLVCLSVPGSAADCVCLYV
jgi:hypothetical protein